MKLSHLVLLILLNCGWATLPAVATLLEGALRPLEFVFLRYAFALVALLAVWPWLPGSIPRGRDFWLTSIMGVVVFTVGHFLQVAGIQASRAADASIMIAIDPLVSSLGAALFLREKIPGRRLVAFALAIVGVAVLSLARRSAPLPGLIANLVIVLSFVSEAVWSVMGKPLVARWGIPKVTALALAAGTFVNAVFLLPTASASLSRFAVLPPVGWFAFAFLGVVLTAFGYSAWYLVIREVPVSLASMTVYLQPILATALAVVLTNERILASHIWGALIIFAGLLLGITRRSAPSVLASETPILPEK